MIDILLVDDHEVVRRGVAELVGGQPDMRVVGDVGTRTEAVEAAARLCPDLAIVDLRLGEDDGIDVCREVLEVSERTSVLILTSFADDPALLRAAGAGATGYILKQVRGTELLSSIRRAAAGELLLDSATRRGADRRIRESGEGLLAELTPQERRVLDLVGLGHSNREISAELCLAEKTVKNYVTSLLRKLSMKSRTEAAVFAARLDERDRLGH